MDGKRGSDGEEREREGEPERNQRGEREREGKRDLSEPRRRKEAEGQRALRAKPWKLPSELVVSAISSVAAIFMAAIPRLPGVSAPRSQDKCLQQNEPQ